MTKKKLVKKAVVASNLEGKTETDFVKAVEDIVQAALNNPTLVPALNPTSATVQTKATNLNTLLITRDTLRAQQKQNTELIIKAEDELKDIINRQWAPYVQIQIGGDVSKAKLLNYGVKGVDDGHTAKVITLAVDSHPLLKRIDLNIHLQQTLHFVNSNSGKNKLPADAKQIDIYEQVGGTVPTSIKTMTHVGIAKRGKFINHFDTTELGKVIYYIAVYIDKKTLLPLEQSPVESGIVN
ncbi:MAG: hypothetical protein ABR968_03600 [Bacteroidales bacterium]|jgi:hypothetical protein